MNDERLADDEVALHSTLKSFVRRFRSEVLAAWREDVRRLPTAAELEPLRLVDSIPDMLDHLADVAAEILTEGPLYAQCESACRHAADRLATGFELSEVVTELSLLRGCIMEVWHRELGVQHIAALRALHLALDRIIAISTERYVEARNRGLAALDRISSASFEANTIDALLQRLLAEFMHATPAVDTAAIMLREGDRLYTRAAIGLDEDVARGYSVEIGEGFCGMVAASRRPVDLRTAHLDPSVTSEGLRRRRVLALTGIPLIQNNRIIGVAHMGSVSIHEFSNEDRQLFMSMAGRATAGINHLLLRTELARSEERYKRIAAEREITLAKLENLLAASPVGIAFLDHDLRYLRTNEALARMNGRSVGDHLGRTVREVLPAEADTLEPLLGHILQTGEPLVDFQIHANDRSFLASYFPVRSPGGIVFGIGAVVTEITDTKPTEKNLEANRHLLQSIIDHAPAAIFVKDEAGRIVMANQILADLMGQPRESVIGMRSGDIWPGDHADAHEANDQLVLEHNQVIEIEETAPGPGGPRTFLTSKFPVVGPDGRRWLCGIAKDITDRKRIEDELRVAIRTREDLIAVVSHDLRNPLSTITLGASLLLSEEAVPPRTRKHVEMVQRSAGRMERLIDDLLDMASIQLGRLSLRHQHVRVRSLIDEAIEAHHPLATDKGIHLVHGNQPPDVEIDCDPERVQRVFSNLIGNAIKFGRTGDTITVAGEGIDRAVRFCVADTGPGIPADAQSRLFDPYWSSPEHARRGAGLGLFISRSIVAAHGGEIHVDSEPGNGSRFVFTLPISR